ncbi:hypothetical protein K490DRAFT_54550 [Saccharata proteae CBS 121410]|uniref:Uncharacterized protein n=1 Tax=Saccharata proteae CBS 121410 TaxID=1314787 RepID=A0A9P4LX20_9PEZI|nr:hypothetical protein K490DRAFT_54550 [Saccharata proteae CBS 121410]
MIGMVANKTKLKRAKSLGQASGGALSGRRRRSSTARLEDGELIGGSSASRPLYAYTLEEAESQSLSVEAVLAAAGGSRRETKQSSDAGTPAVLPCEHGGHAAPFDSWWLVGAQGSRLRAQGSCSLPASSAGDCILTDSSRWQSRSRSTFHD